MRTSHAARCSRHPSVETRVRCGICGAPICPRCTTSTPDGPRCREHAPAGVSRFLHAAVLRNARGAAAGLATGVVLGVAWGMALRAVPLLFWGIWFVFLGIGYVVGEATARVAGRKPHWLLSGFAAMGTIIAILASAFLFVPPEDRLAFLINPVRLVVEIIACILAGSRVRAAPPALRKPQ